MGKPWYSIVGCVCGASWPGGAKPSLAFGKCFFLRLVQDSSSSVSQSHSVMQQQRRHSSAKVGITQGHEDRK